MDRDDPAPQHSSIGMLGSMYRPAYQSAAHSSSRIPPHQVNQELLTHDPA